MDRQAKVRKGYSLDRECESGQHDIDSDENDGEDCDQQSLPLSKAIAKKGAEQDSHFFNNSKFFH